MKTIVEIDLFGYSDIVLEIEKSFGAHMVFELNDQIQSFIDFGLDKVGKSRTDTVIAENGDNVVLIFNQAVDAHYFSVAVQKHTEQYNDQRTTSLAQRWFRVGCATGEVAKRNGRNSINVTGFVIAKAYRLESSAPPGGILIDDETYKNLPRDLKYEYRSEMEVYGKRNEKFKAYPWKYNSKSRFKIRQNELGKEHENSAVLEANIKNNLTKITGLENPPKVCSENQSSDIFSTLLVPIDYEETCSFIGRKRDLSELENLVRQEKKIIVILARGGTGKTTLAQFYLEHRFGEDSIIDIMVNQEIHNIPSVEDLVEELLIDLGSTPIACLPRALKRLKKKILCDKKVVFIDNFETLLDHQGKIIKEHSSYLELLKLLNSISSQTVVLITSREPIKEENITVYHYKLGDLSLDAWKSCLAKQGIKTEQYKEILREIYDIYAGNAKALQLIGCSVAEDYSGDLLSYFEENTFKDKETPELNIEQDIEYLIESHFNRLKAMHLQAYVLLCRFSCYQHRGIKKLSIEGIENLSWGNSKEEVIKFIRYLRNLCLLEFNKNEYWLHPLIRREALKRLKKDKDELANSHQAAIALWLRKTREYNEEKSINSINIMHSSDLNDKSVDYLMNAFWHAAEIEDWKQTLEITVDYGLLEKLDTISMPKRSIQIGELLYKKMNSIDSSLNSLVCQKMEVLQYLGHAYLDFGNIDKSHTFYNQWLIEAQNQNDLCNQAQALSNLGLISHNKSDYMRSLDYHQNALGVIKKAKISGSWIEAFILGNIGLAYLMQINAINAIKNLRKSININKEIGNKQWMSYPLSSLGLTYAKLKRKKRGVLLANKAVSISEEVGDIWGTVFGLQNLSESFVDLKRYDAAIDSINKAIPLLEEHGDQRAVYIISGIWGLALGGNKLYEQAIEKLIESVEGMEKIGISDKKTDFLISLAENYYLIGESSLASNTIEKIRLEQSCSNLIHISEALADLEMRFL